MTLSERLQRASGGIMARSYSGPRMMARDWLIIIVTAGATAIFTAAAQYVATVKVENDKVRSANVVKMADDFQTRVSSLMRSLEKLITLAGQDQKIPDSERHEVVNEILTMQLMLSPATGKWPDHASLKVNNFFTGLQDIEETVRLSKTPADLEPLSKKLRTLVVDDLELIKEMQKDLELHYISIW